MLIILSHLQFVNLLNAGLWRKQSPQIKTNAQVQLDTDHLDLNDFKCSFVGENMQLAKYIEIVHVVRIYVAFIWYCTTRKSLISIFRYHTETKQKTSVRYEKLHISNALFKCLAANLLRAMVVFCFPSKIEHSLKQTNTSHRSKSFV